MLVLAQALKKISWQLRFSDPWVQVVKDEPDETPNIAFRRCTPEHIRSGLSSIDRLRLRNCLHVEFLNGDEYSPVYSARSMNAIRNDSA